MTCIWQRESLRALPNLPLPARGDCSILNPTPAILLFCFNAACLRPSPEKESLCWRAPWATVVPQTGAVTTRVETRLLRGQHPPTASAVLPPLAHSLLPHGSHAARACSPSPAHQGTRKRLLCERHTHRQEKGESEDFHTTPTKSKTVNNNSPDT